MMNNGWTEKVKQLECENRRLRQMLCLRHGCTSLYLDDGELQCSTCGIDFLRDPIDVIEKKWFDAAMALFLKTVPCVDHLEEKL
jgi:hypothetical protein